MWIKTILIAGGIAYVGYRWWTGRRAAQLVFDRDAGKLAGQQDAMADNRDVRQANPRPNPTYAAGDRERQVVYESAYREAYMVTHKVPGQPRLIDTPEYKLGDAEGRGHAMEDKKAGKPPLSRPSFTYPNDALAQARFAAGYGAGYVQAYPPK